MKPGEQLKGRVLRPKRPSIVVRCEPTEALDGQHDVHPALQLLATGEMDELIWETSPQARHQSERERKEK